MGLKMKTLLMLLILTLPCYAGVNFSMLGDPPQFNAFRSSQEATNFAKNYVGSSALEFALRLRIENNVHILAQLLDYPPNASINEKLSIMEKASKLAKQNEYYRIALRVVDSGVGASVATRSVPANRIVVTYGETDDCHEESTRTPVYDKDDGHLTGYLVESPCEQTKEKK